MPSQSMQDVDKKEYRADENAYKGEVMLNAHV